MAVRRKLQTALRWGKPTGGEDLRLLMLVFKHRSSQASWLVAKTELWLRLCCAVYSRRE